MIKDDNKKVVGIQGKVRNTKNKCSVPFRECEFELMWDEGLNAFAGILSQLLTDGVIKQTGSWYSFGDIKFQKKQFNEGFITDEVFSELRKEIGL